MSLRKTERYSIFIPMEFHLRTHHKADSYVFMGPKPKDDTSAGKWPAMCAWCQLPYS